MKRPALANRWKRPVWAGLSIVGALMLVYLFLFGEGTDSYAYWSFDPVHPYANAMGNLDAWPAFRYSPPMAMLFSVFHALPWPAYEALWLAVLLGCLWFLLGRWALAAVAFYPIALELGMGQINLILAVAIVVGFRYPASWALVLLTKVTPGVGLVWFAVRREWRAVAVALGVAVAIAATSLVIAPDLWRQWLAMLASNVGAPPPTWMHLPIPLWVRGPLAVVLIAYAARMDRRWLVPIGCWLAYPVLWFEGPAIVLASVTLWTGRWQGRPSTATRSRSLRLHPQSHLRSP